MKRIAVTIVLGAGLAAVAAGCSETKDVLGISAKAPPDEFSVYARAPLNVPPDFGLRPPAPGQSRPDEVDPRADARRVMLSGRSAAAAPGQEMTPGTTALLRQAGALDVDPDIRAAVDRETSILIEEDQSFTDSLLFWQEPPQPGTTVDPAKESQRIKENQALGNPVTTGQSPVVEKKEKGWLEGIFD